MLKFEREILKRQMRLLEVVREDEKTFKSQLESTKRTVENIENSYKAKIKALEEVLQGLSEPETE